MSYSGAEPAELLAFRARLCGINTDAPSIQGLSVLMRGPHDSSIRQRLLRVWFDDVQQSSDPSRLLALIYLANDVIQLLRGSEHDLVYRYNFAVPFAKAIITIKEKAPNLSPKLERILGIFKDRVIYDSQVLKLLQRVLQEDANNSDVLGSLLHQLNTETTLNLNERFKQLGKEYHEKLGTIHPLIKQQLSHVQHSSQQQQQQQQQHTQHSQQQQHHHVSRYHSHHQRQIPVAVSKVIPEPLLEDLIQAGRQLKMQCCYEPRPHQCVDLDAEVVSRVRGHRTPPNARIGLQDSNFIEVYRALLNDHRNHVTEIREKIARRKKEEEKGPFLLMSNCTVSQPAVISAAERIKVLMKKEWSSRNQLNELEHAIYHKLVEILGFLGCRQQRIQSIVESVEKETQRRNETSIDDS